MHGIHDKSKQVLSRLFYPTSDLTLSDYLFFIILLIDWYLGFFPSQSHFISFLISIFLCTIPTRRRRPNILFRGPDITHKNLIVNTIFIESISWQ